MKTDKLYFVGFMCAGKTTAARELAAYLQWSSADLDEIIEGREGRTIFDIFKEEGEPYFRRIETAELFKLLYLRRLVIATGGGTFIQEENRDVMLRDGIVVWLDVPFRVVLERLRADTTRPLAQELHVPENVEKLEQRYRERLPIYAQAHIRLDATMPDPARVVKAIVKVIPSLLP